MRHQLLKLTKKNSTKAERVFAEVCKELHVPFRAKVKVKGHEVDFLIGRFAIEIDGHPQDAVKNHKLADEYIPLHIPNAFCSHEYLREFISQLWVQHFLSSQSERASSRRT